MMMMMMMMMMAMLMIMMFFDDKGSNDDDDDKNYLSLKSIHKLRSEVTCDYGGRIVEVGIVASSH